EVAELRAQMQRMRPDEDKEAYMSTFADLTALEKYRRSLNERSNAYGEFTFGNSFARGSWAVRRSSHLARGSSSYACGRERRGWQSLAGLLGRAGAIKLARGTQSSVDGV